MHCLQGSTFLPNKKNRAYLIALYNRYTRFSLVIIYLTYDILSGQFALWFSGHSYTFSVFVFAI